MKDWKPVSPWIAAGDCRVVDLHEVCSATVELVDYSHASAIDHGILIYEASQVLAAAASPDGRRSVHAELSRALSDGPGIVVFRAAFLDASGASLDTSGPFLDTSVVDRASVEFQKMIDVQNLGGVQAGDHFAKPGANDRVWNALERLAVQAPFVFVDYYGNDILALVSEAWLGPNYQVTSQINVVNPGGQAQKPHRDYHLGFLNQDTAERFPIHVHTMSPLLTLQGAVAHTDMPIATGPTMYLPHSHKYPHGYVAWWLPEFEEYFAANYVQIPLRVGDAAFFNPAVFHGAGTNVTTEIRRMANLLQVSSAFGRAMETVDRYRMVEALYPAVVAAHRSGRSSQHIDNAIAASAEGYAFPTNLDRDPPLGGLTPDSQADVVRRAVHDGWSHDDLRRTLELHRMKRNSA